MNVLQKVIKPTGDCPTYVVGVEYSGGLLGENVETVFLRYDVAGIPNAYLDQK